MSLRPRAGWTPIGASVLALVDCRERFFVHRRKQLVAVLDCLLAVEELDVVCDAGARQYAISNAPPPDVRAGSLATRNLRFGCPSRAPSTDPEPREAARSVLRDFVLDHAILGDGDLAT